MAGLSRWGCLWVLVGSTACAGGGSEQPKTQFDTAPKPGGADDTADPSTSDGEVSGDDTSGGDVSSTSASTSGTAEAESGLDQTDTTSTSSDPSTTADDSTLPPPVCGDGLAEGDETCDGADLRGQACTDVGFDGGALACLGDCSGFDTSGCTVAPFCGDGVKNGAEPCDGADLGGQTCQSLGWDMGALSCTANCTLDTSSCANAPCTPIFGNCSQVPCCAGLVCLPIDGHHCSPVP